MRASAGGAVRAAIAGAVVAALMTLPGLGVGTLWDNSETAYGEVAREILLTHDWVVMHLNNVPYFVQPPLYFWLGAFFSLFAGPTPFAMRLPSALATIALCAFTGYAVARQAGARVGIYASVILSTSLMQAVIGRLAIMDALLDLTVAMTIFWWFRALETGRDRYAIFGWIAAGLGFLAKGLVAPVVALLVIVPFFLWNRRIEPTHPPSARAWIAGLAAFVVVAAPWPIALVAHYHLSPLQKLIGEYTIGRYTGVVENQSGPIWYYVPVIILGFFPWIAFLPMAVAYGLRGLRAGAVENPATARLVRLAFTWGLVPLLFFSFASTKLPNYVALEFPALALLTALYFEAVVRRGGTRSAVVLGGNRADYDRRARLCHLALHAQQSPNDRDRDRRSATARDGGCDLCRLAADRVAWSRAAERSRRAVRARPGGGRRYRRARDDGAAARRGVQAGAAARRHDSSTAPPWRRRRDPRSLRRKRAALLHASRRKRAGAAQRRRSPKRRHRAAQRHLRRHARG